MYTSGLLIKGINTSSVMTGCVFGSIPFVLRYTKNVWARDQGNLNVENVCILTENKVIDDVW